MEEMQRRMDNLEQENKSLKQVLVDVEFSVCVFTRRGPSVAPPVYIG